MRGWQGRMVWSERRADFRPEFYYRKEGYAQDIGAE